MKAHLSAMNANQKLSHPMNHRTGMPALKITHTKNAL
jgi:hypothetical protein